MPSVNVSYFSGTGNSAHAAKLAEKHFSALGYSVALNSIEQNKTLPPADKNIFIFPVYGMLAPHIFINFLKKLPGGNGARAAIIAVHGNSGREDGNEGYSLKQVQYIISKRGYDVAVTAAVGYPSNFTQIVPPPSEEKVKNIFSSSDEKVSAILKKIETGEKDIKPCGFIKAFFSILFGWSFYYVGRHFMGKFYVADEKCNLCQVCVKNCPVKVIRICGNKPRWGWNCEGCQRCINSCPTKAIQTSLLRLIVFQILYFAGLGLVIFSVKFRALLGLGCCAWVSSAAIFSAGYMLLCFILDPLIFAAEKSGFAPKLFYFAHNRKFRRYLANGYKPN
ncbi:MAG: EFR1 family ferrodoxin [Elusimicrobia bacterium]|nr:EFR1 family ferrodoxin [Elusimicrobiota bacterium]